MRWATILSLAGFLAVTGCGVRNPAGVGNGGWAASSLPGNEVVADFADHPDRYVGKTLRLKMSVRESIRGGGQSSLKDFAGKPVSFTAFDPASSASADLVVTMLNDPNEIPNVGHVDDVLVTFTCAEGSLTKGNVATAITRP